MVIDLEQKAHLTRDLRTLLIFHNFFSFRAQICFAKSAGNMFGFKKTIYGDEHRCTYNQCLAGYRPHIELIKQRGYQALIGKIERDYKGKFTHATIYMRTDLSSKEFPITCRHYTRTGEDMSMRNDPVLSEDEGTIVYFTIDKTNNRLLLSSEDPNAIDFKSELASNLDKTIQQKF